MKMDRLVIGELIIEHWFAICAISAVLREDYGNFWESN